MSGVKYLTDTNIIIGLLKGYHPAIDALGDIEITDCAYSPVTRMELLGFHAITPDEEVMIESLLVQMTRLGVTPAVEDVAIKLRKNRRLKLPDAIISATAIAHDLVLLTLDKELH